MRDIEEAFAGVTAAIRAHRAVPDDVMAGLEELRSSLARWHAGSSGELHAPSHGAWVVAPSGVHIDLGRRRPLRRLTAALVEARVARPGRSLSAAELIAAGWPEEPNDGEASANRLRVGLCRLRQLGLDGLIVTTSTGWLLNPNVPIVRDERDELASAADSESDSGIFAAALSTEQEIESAAPTSNVA
jgi:hypothetical protein